MEKVRGIGGVFFKAQDPKALTRWYADHLGFPVEDWGGVSFAWDDPTGNGRIAWNAFSADTTYFAPSTKPFMFNLRVDDLDAMLAQLRALGDTVDDKIDESELGKFGWVMDPEGNRIELWQPPGRAR